MQDETSHDKTICYTMRRDIKRQDYNKKEDFKKDQFPVKVVIFLLNFVFLRINHESLSGWGECDKSGSEPNSRQVLKIEDGPRRVLNLRLLVLPTVCPKGATAPFALAGYTPMGTNALQGFLKSFGALCGINC